MFVNVPAGNYKLKFTLGTGTSLEDFIANAKPVSVTLKAAKQKVTKGNFKAITTYKIEEVSGAKVELGGKGNNVVEDSVVFYDLKNANIKGTENEFLSYFELRDNCIYLKNELTVMEIRIRQQKQ